MDDVRFSTSLPRAEYAEMVRRAAEDDRSVASVARRVLMREFFVPAALVERDGASASRSASAADGAASPRSASAVGGTGGLSVPVRAVAAPAPRSSSGGVCDKTGLLFRDCLCAEHKGMS